MRLVLRQSRVTIDFSGRTSSQIWPSSVLTYLLNCREPPCYERFVEGWRTVSRNFHQTAAQQRYITRPQHTLHMSVYKVISAHQVQWCCLLHSCSLHCGCVLCWILYISSWQIEEYHTYIHVSLVKMSILRVCTCMYSIWCVYVCMYYSNKVLVCMYVCMYA